MTFRPIIFITYYSNWMNFFYFLRESGIQAVRELKNNKLRTFLSLLGIMIGIFCIISAQSAVHSLEQNIRSSFEKLGNDVLYIDRRPWTMVSEEEMWKYENRPMPTINDFDAIKRKSKLTEMASISSFVGSRVAKFQNNSVDGTFILGVSEDYSNIFSLGFDSGRFFTYNDMKRSANTVVLGYEVAANLFGNVYPIGKQISLGGKRLTVIGVLEKSGKSLINPLNFDQVALIPFAITNYYANLNGGWVYIQMNSKAKSGVSIAEYKDEITGILRGTRKLKPIEDDNFSLNELSLLNKTFDTVFGTLRIAGLIIGGFSILVGIFSVANIMFVSVKERTHLIGIKKAVGAKSKVILMEFLLESTVLCVIGGLMGLALVYLVLKAISHFSSFEMYLDLNNLVIGLLLSVVVGLLAGVIPALQASRMMPVDAIRQG